MIRTPYTVRGISRVPCFRTGCGSPARHQWQVCADKNTWRPLCLACDVALNDLTLRFMRLPDRARKMRAYVRRMAHV
jgi:hypothetical protein